MGCDWRIGRQVDTTTTRGKEAFDALFVEFFIMRDGNIPTFISTGLPPLEVEVEQKHRMR